MKKISKKQLNLMKQKASEMTDAEFKKQGSSMLQTLTLIVKEASEQGKISSKFFYNAVNKEMDLLTSLIKSNEYTTEEKIYFSKRISALVDKLQRKDIIKDASILASFLALAGAAVCTTVSMLKLKK